MVAPVQQLLASCKSLEEFRERLPEVIPQLDAEQLTELIAKGLFAGTLAGRTGAV
jgi:phage gp29-like protein